MERSCERTDEKIRQRNALGGEMVEDVKLAVATLLGSARMPSTASRRRVGVLNQCCARSSRTNTIWFNGRPKVRLQGVYV